MKRLIPYVISAALLTAGLAAALVIAPSAKAWGPTDLPAGWNVSHGTDVNPASLCPEWYRVNAYDNGHATAVSDPLCTNSPTYQQDFDAFVNAHYTPPPPVTTAAPDPTTPTTTQTTPATPAPVTTTATSTSPAPTPAEQTLADQVALLQAQIAALTDRVSRLEQAGDAAWLAFQQAVQGGADPAAAADTARGTWLNAVNGLGAFAP